MRYRPFVIAAATCLLFSTAFTSPAHAATKAKVKFDRARVGQGEQTTVRWSVSGRPKGGSVLLQRTYGTSGTYRTIKKVGWSGSTKVTAPSRGRYRYRIVVRDSHRRTRATVATTLYSYANIQLSTLASDSTDTINVGGALFRYVFARGDSGYRTYLRLDSTTCRGGSLDIAKTGGAGNTGAVTFVQEFGDEQTFEVTTGNIEHYRFTLASRGAVQLNISDASDSPSGSTYVNAIFSCYTATGNA